MIVNISPSIVSDDDIWIDFPSTFDVMANKKDFTVVVKAKGGNTGSADVTMSLSVWCDIDPQAHNVDDVAVETESWANLTKGIYRPDLNQMVDADSIDFVGNTEVVTWLDLDNLNADKVKFKLTFSGTPILATPASIIIKARRDQL